ATPQLHKLLVFLFAFALLRFGLTPLYLFFFLCNRRHPDLHSFPTRRSSDLLSKNICTCIICSTISPADRSRFLRKIPLAQKNREDRKSTRLNSSHVSISYAVFCLKKKKLTRSDHVHQYMRRLSASLLQ